MQRSKMMVDLFVQVSVLTRIRTLQMARAQEYIPTEEAFSLYKFGLDISALFLEPSIGGH